jgi:hypothetical protein
MKLSTNTREPGVSLMLHPTGTSPKFFVTVPGLDGKRYKRSFAIARHGFACAFSLALAARNDLVRKHRKGIPLH